MRLILALLCSLALAGEGLYPPAPPADAALVRVVEAGGAWKVAGKDLAAGAGASAYVAVQAGARTLDPPGPAGESKTLVAGHYYTAALLQDGSVRLFDDPPREDLAKATLRLYNLSGAPAPELRTADGKITVVSAVVPASAGMRAVNPISAGFTVWADGAAIATFPATKLAAGASYSVFVFGQPGALRAVWVEDRAG